MKTFIYGPDRARQSWSSIDRVGEETMRGPSCLFGLFLLAGCSFSETIAQHAISYNKMVAEADDSQTLLNILRARDRLPLHFTAVQDVQGKLEQSTGTTFSLTIPFGGDAASNFPFGSQLQLNQKSNPLFNIGVLGNSEDFVQAITEPIEPAVVKKFFDQGWPVDFLLYLLVERFEVRPVPSPGQGDREAGVATKSRSYSQDDLESLLGPCLFEKRANSGPRVARNDPRVGSFACFVQIVERLASGENATDVEDTTPYQSGESMPARLQLVDAASGKLVGPSYDSLTPEQLAKLLALKAEGVERSLIEVREDGKTRYRLCQVSRSTKYCASSASCAQIRAAAAQVCQASQEDPTLGSKSISDSLSQERGFYSIVGESKESPETGGAESYELLFHVRSLHSVIYYVGEMIRTEDDDPEKKHLVYIRRDQKRQGCSGDDEEQTGKNVPIFDVMGNLPVNSAVSVDHLGKTYWIPPHDRCSRSLQTLAFLNQISGLYQSRADLPTTSTLQTIAR